MVSSYSMRCIIGYFQSREKFIYSAKRAGLNASNTLFSITDYTEFNIQCQTRIYIVFSSLLDVHYLIFYTTMHLGIKILGGLQRHWETNPLGTREIK